LSGARIADADDIDLEPWQAPKCVPDLHTRSLLVSSNNRMLAEVEYHLLGRKRTIVLWDERLLDASGNKLGSAG